MKVYVFPVLSFFFSGESDYGNLAEAEKDQVKLVYNFRY